ncbi:MAG: hypothetical protein IT557_11630 [Alphaproteobacteria bacterium]|nr:hypothetical protein [Alphaproteobacteria bacterium]
MTAAVGVTLGEYATIADAVYGEEAELSTRAQGWTCQRRVAATLSLGFQGAILDNGREIIVAFKGTAPTTRAVVADLQNDLVLFLNGLPNQAAAADALVRQAAQIARGKPISLTGHSLGGALCQVVGYWSGKPFVTFNAPPMLANLVQARLVAWTGATLAPLAVLSGLVESARTNTAVGGVGGQSINYMVRTDIISGVSIRPHYGRVVKLENTVEGGGDHSMTTMLSLLRMRSLWNRTPW